MAHAGAHGISLEEYTNTTPPGWIPHEASYTFRMYQDKIQLWIRGLPDVEGTPGYKSKAQIASAIIGRLRGAAFRAALDLRVTTHVDKNGIPNKITGVDAATFEGFAKLRDANDPNLIVRHAVPSGIEHLMQVLQASYGRTEVDESNSALQALLHCQRGQNSLLDYIVAFKKKYERAVEKAGFSMNNVGKTFKFIEGAGLAQRYIDDVMLKVDGDTERFDDIITIVTRTAKQHQHTPEENLHGSILLAMDHFEYTEPYQEPTVTYHTDVNSQW